MKIKNTRDNFSEQYKNKQDAQRNMIKQSSNSFRDLKNIYVGRPQILSPEDKKQVLERAVNVSFITGKHVISNRIDNQQQTNQQQTMPSIFNKFQKLSVSPLNLENSKAFQVAPKNKTIDFNINNVVSSQTQKSKDDFSKTKKSDTSDTVQVGGAVCSQSEVEYKNSNKTVDVIKNINAINKVKLNRTFHAYQKNVSFNPNPFISKPLFLTNNNLMIASSNVLKRELHEQSDYGLSSVTTTYHIAETSVNVFRAAQLTSDILVRTPPKLINNTIHLAEKTYQTGNIIKKEIFIVGDKIVRFANNMNRHQFANATIKAHENLQRAKKTTVYTTKKHIQKINNLKKTTVAVVKDAITGELHLQLKKGQLPKAIQTTKDASRHLVIHTTSKTIKSVPKLAKAGIVGGGNTIKILGKGSLASAQFFENSEDMGVQALSAGIKTTSHVIELSKMTATTTIKTGIYLSKSGVGAVKKGYALKRNVQREVKVINRLSKHQRSRYLKNKVSGNIKKGLKKTASSVVDLILNGIKKTVMKFLIPVLLIIGGIAAVYNTTMTPVAYLGTVFGGAFSIYSPDTGEYTDFEVHDYLVTQIPRLKSNFVLKIENVRDNNLVENGGYYHYVRLFEENNSDEIDITESNIYNAIFTDEELIQLIEPVFQSIIFTDYDLMPTEKEVNDTLDDIFDTIVYVNTEQLPTEYCNEICSSCKHVHANVSTCPNMKTGTHWKYTCKTCCYKQKHKIYIGKRHGEKQYRTYETDECRGYHYCQGHRILGITINLDGYYELLAKYYTDEIDRLANITNPSNEETQKLDLLKSNYELCLAIMDVVISNTSSGLTISDISNVVFSNGSRTPNEALVNLALEQVGNMGGIKYWKWYGFASRVEWCACFVSWCADQMGYIDSGQVPKFASCRMGISDFKSSGHWANGQYNEPVGGDVIFFDWDRDGNPNHVGFVIGNDGERVYTVEGNSGDVCRIRSYLLSSTVILGYGLPNY